MQSQQWIPSELALCPKQPQLSSQTCGAHVPLLSCVPCAHYLTPPPKDPAPPVHSHTHRVEEQMGGRRRRRDPALAPTRQRGAQTLSRCTCSGLTPASGLGPEQGFTWGKVIEATES